ncbi:Cytochrome P450 [Canna indica]|uniref:Cytochrome P450 n=1 Tax=Canna indica TaxID=4628 RepID=A0AAQ3KTW0_9LILI|nr:Cytochrome P450 [Canna indica]
MAPHTVIFCLLFSVPLILFLLGHGRRRRSGKLPPGPPQLPIIGNLHQLGAAPQVTLTEMAAEHGPLMFLRLGSIPTLVISSSDAACEVIRHHDLAFSGRPVLFAAKKLSYGLLDVVFVPPGGYWRMARKVMMVELLSAKRVQSFRKVREEEVARVVESIREHSSSSSSLSSTIDLSKMVLSMANSIVCRAAFGEKHGGGGGGGVEIHRVLAEAQDVLGGFCVGDFFPWMRWIHGLDGLQARVEKVFKELDGFYNQVIEEHLKKEPSSEHVDMVDVLLRLLEDPTHRKTFSSMDHIKGLLTVSIFN